MVFLSFVKYILIVKREWNQIVAAADSQLGTASGAQPDPGSTMFP